MPVVAGPLTAELSSDGWLRNVTLGDEEVLHGVGVVVRDAHWATIPGDITWEQRDVEHGTFSARVVSDHSRHGVPFVWSADITGTASGVITVQVSGLTKQRFETNRIGIVVLHSLDSAGGRCRITHSDGALTLSGFPRGVAPHQVFTDVRTMEAECRLGTVRLDFAGDVFETEDQRNWSDASFKTYSRPLALPRPYLLDRTETVTQALTISVDGAARPPVSRGVVEPVQIKRGRDIQAPSIGLALAQALELDRESPSSIGHVRLTTDMRDIDQLAQDLEAATGLGIPVELAVRVEPDGDPADVAEAIRASGARVEAVMISSPRPTTTKRDVGSVLRHVRPVVERDTLFYAGTEASLAELNRNRFDGAAWGIDGVMLSLCPQLHDHTDEAVMESVWALPDVISSARSSSGLARVAITPITLEPGPIHYDPGTPIEVAQSTVRDPRELTAFGGAWTLAVVSTLAEQGVAHITAFAPPTVDDSESLLGELAHARGLASLQFSASGLSGMLIDERRLVVVNTGHRDREISLVHSGRSARIAAHAAASFPW